MCRRRSLALATALSTLAAAQDAVDARTVQTPFGPVTVRHDRPEFDAPKVTLWACYADDAGALADHRQYLQELVVRWRERGVAVAVALADPAAAKRVAAADPDFVVGTTSGAAGGATFALCRGVADAVFRTDTLDGVADAVQRVLADEDVDALPRDHALLEGTLAGVADGGEFGDQVEQSLRAFPRSGRAHACAVLYHWWCKGDLDAAAKAVHDGVAALATETVPMTMFADLVLRGDRNDPEIPRQLAVAMAPAAATAPDGAFTQLVYLRALLRAGQDRLAGRLAATLPKRLAGDPRHLLVFAETLMEAGTPAAHRDAAMRAIRDAEAALAEASGLDDRWVWAARHKVLWRCDDHEAAAKLMADYRERNVSNYGLNNDAWYLIVRPETMGRFDTLALAQAEEMLRVEGANIDYGSKDTVALAMFVNGRVDRAVELQTEATDASGNQATYVGRLTRFRNTQALRRK